MNLHKLFSSFFFLFTTNVYAFNFHSKVSSISSFNLHRRTRTSTITRRKIPFPSKSHFTVIPSTADNNIQYGTETLDPSTYEASLLKVWDEDTQLQRGFDWEIEKLRRYFSGLYQQEDGTWMKRPSIFNFLISKSRMANTGRTRMDNDVASSAPKPVNFIDVMILFATQMLSNVGFGPMLGMAAVPDAVIQKYEGSFYSFIKGVLGGDLQTLAGGPLFLLLAKYYQDYGPIFNLSFGPKSFLVVSDPVMAKHILKSNPEQYCKGMLAEILEPIMGNGLIPADPATWKVKSKS